MSAPSCVWGRRPHVMPSLPVPRKAPGAVPGAVVSRQDPGFTLADLRISARHRVTGASWRAGHRYPRGDERGASGTKRRRLFLEFGHPAFVAHDTAPGPPLAHLPQCVAMDPGALAPDRRGGRSPRSTTGLHTCGQHCGRPGDTEPSGCGPAGGGRWTTSWRDPPITALTCAFVSTTLWTQDFPPAGQVPCRHGHARAEPVGRRGAPQ